jgi:catechol 2,3-dioxygenase-like lactoylglutathione lyase family enzyme
MGHIKHVGVIGVYVSNVDAAIRFFVEQLDFELRSDDVYGEGMRWVEVAPAGAQTLLTLSQPSGPDDLQPGDTPLITFEVDDLDAAATELRERGVDVDAEPFPAPPPVPPMIFFRDPDGNRFLLVERH